MNLQNTGRLLAALMGIAMIGITAVHAAATTAPAKPVPAKAAVPMPTVKLGGAMLEEYHGENPARRTIILRGGDVARRPRSSESVKKRS